MRALRADNSRLEARLDRLESGRAVGASMPRPQSEPKAASSQLTPQLTVVKLKPRHEPAPRLATQVAVVEPAPEVVEALKPTPQPSPDEAAPVEDGDQVFERGVEALKTGNVEGGVEQLQRFAADQPKHAKADNALYWSGLGLLGMNDLAGASKAFEAVIDRYPAGDVVQDSMLKLAECRSRLKQPLEAKAMYQKIVADYPGSPAATQAQAELSAMK